MSKINDEKDDGRGAGAPRIIDVADFVRMAPMELPATVPVTVIDGGWQPITLIRDDQTIEAEICLELGSSLQNPDTRSAPFRAAVESLEHEGKVTEGHVQQRAEFILIRWKTLIYSHQSTADLWAHVKFQWDVIHSRAEKTSLNMPQTMPPIDVILINPSVRSRVRTAHESFGPFSTKLGGEPDWIQTENVPNCPLCRKPMRFVAQIDSILHRENPGLAQQAGTEDDDYCFGDAGMIYVFFCFKCAETHSLCQYH